MADKILPQRVSAFHSSPQLTPTSRCSTSSPSTPPTSSVSPPPLRSRASAVTVTFTLYLKS